ncbi:MAG: hypothetical protein JW862_18485 [Anaerolineales bacterium]|nr:hypothetical protein [Anaerolineales bacterium]
MTNLSQLLETGMGTRLHWFPADVPVSQLAAVLVGMANTTGGTILLGIAPRSARVLGIRDLESLLDRVFQAALLSEPTLVLPLPQVESYQQEQLLRIEVPEGLPHVYSLDGRYLGRKAAQTSPLAARDLRALLVERGVLQFESRLAPGASLSDLELERVSAYAAALGYPVDAPLETLLLRRGCVQRAGDQLKPTYAGLLLFSSHPQQWLPSATILAARFPGISISDQFVKQEIRGPLPDQLRQAETFVRDHLRSTVRLVGLRRQETPEYPPEVVRELLVNAVAHRDYNQQGDGIHLHIFADRLEVHSPGGLPGPVNLSNLLEARFSRNAVVAQLLSDLGFVERLGYGLNRVVTVLRQQNLPQPSFEEIGGSFRVTISRGDLAPGDDEVRLAVSDYQLHDLNVRQEMAVGYLLNQKRITNSDFQNLCPEVSSETLRRDLADLVAKGLLIKVGQKRATYYILKR